MAKQPKTTKTEQTKKASKRQQKKPNPELEAKQQEAALRKFLYPHATD